MKELNMQLHRSYTDNQLSPTIDGRSLQLPPSERTDEPESLEYSILDVLKTASDPSKVVLDFIQKPIVPPCMKGDNAISHIFVLEQLMHISPHVKPHLREEAMRLAHDLKANIREISENSLVALCFLQLLSIFGLLSSFAEDEVLEIFEFAAHHKQTVDLFRTLGFADKVSDFVQGLIKKEKYFGAVRFICAFKLEEKNQPVDLLRKYAQNAKLMTERICKNAKSLEIKDNARDQEIASLKSVQQCISDNSLESEDLSNEIQHRINELNWNKGTGVYNLRKRKASNGH
ncbi:FRIGIDA-like protein 3 [Lotus japonicus]|uniref:FRIGIDA-like protein 3 n=1 Tax=Lotus japonicus TaxID=34305 RepID=UPI002583833F|nr:FRIGIDA-like protein 3 [Lotus japonicus]